MEKIFELADVNFSYLGKFPALNNISLAIDKGENVVILGANGSGKSTLLHLLAGLIFPSKGSVAAFGRVINRDVFDDESFRQYFRKRVVVLFQNSDVQLFSPTVEEELYFGPLQLEIKIEEAKKIIDSLSEMLDIKKLFNRSPYQLSVGEKKKVAIASILAISPEVLLLDEPTAGLDPRTSRELIDLITQYHGQGKTIIAATHDLHFVSEVADKIYILSEEKTIAASGTKDEILSNRDLLNSHNLVHIHSHMHKDNWHKHLHQHGDKVL